MRILDANFNRTREGLRVVEDYARFTLNHDGLCGALKTLRHDFAMATRTQQAEAILFRDTPGDVGTGITTPAELTRANVTDIVTAAGKRVGEALRSVEEFLKTTDPVAAGAVEKLRYRFYEIERQVALTLLGVRGRFADVRLYVLITEAVCRGGWYRSAEEALDGGADCLQLREKNLDSAELLRRAKRLVDLCRKRRVISIINDRPDIALLSGADGVHVGQDDLPATDVRKLIGTEKIVGVSTHEIAHARRAVLDGADYVGVGPVYLSETKPREISPGLPYLKQVVNEIPLPAVAIAGITLDRLDDILATGVKAVAVTAAVVGQPDISAAARAFKSRLH